MQSSTYPSRHQTFLILLAILAFLLPVLACIVLPTIGVGVLKQFFQFNRLILLFGGIIGGVCFLQYFRFIQSRPQLLVVFIAIAWPIVSYYSGQLMSFGINLHLRPLLMAAIAAPSIWIGIRYHQLLFQKLPWLKYYAFFIGWLLLYSTFFNANTTDPYFKGGGEASEGSISLIQVNAYVYCLLAMVVSGATMLRAKNPQKMFDLFNKALILVTGLEAVVTILGFPFGLFSMPIDGFMRAVGLFGHPNPYAHHMGIIMIYLLGLFCYYQGERADRMPSWMLFGSLGVNGIAFLLGLSKTAMGAYTACAFLLLLLNLSVPAVRSGFFKIAIAGIILVPIGLVAFQVLSGESFFSILESRMEQTDSMNWRTSVWQELLGNINLTTLWFGHGLTSANLVLYQISYSDAHNAKPLIMVHNAYLALLYDMGIFGYSMFACTLSFCWQSIKNGFRSIKTEYTIILALSLYFLCACGFDEMSYMFDAPMIYWTFCSILYCLTVRESESVEKRFA